MFSRRKICWKVRMTEVVPAPDEPVMTTTGCLVDIALLSCSVWKRPRAP